VFEPDNLRPFVEAIAAEGGRSQSQVDNLMNHISRRHDYLNDFIQPLLASPVVGAVHDGNDIISFLAVGSQ